MVFPFPCDQKVVLGETLYPESQAAEKPSRAEVSWEEARHDSIEFQFTEEPPDRRLQPFPHEPLAFMRGRNGKAEMARQKRITHYVCKVDEADNLARTMEAKRKPTLRSLFDFSRLEALSPMAQ